MNDRMNLFTPEAPSIARHEPAPIRPGNARRSITLLACLLLTVLVFVAEAAPRQPNIVLIFADDQGYGDLGHTGNAVIKTPHLDALAAQSSQLTDYHVAPTCSPTRAASLTGHWIITKLR